MLDAYIFLFIVYISDEKLWLMQCLPERVKALKNKKGWFC